MTEVRYPDPGGVLDEWVSCPECGSDAGFEIHIHRYNGVESACLACEACGALSETSAKK